jgi:hypothetical protein
MSEKKVWFMTGASRDDGAVCRENSKDREGEKMNYETETGRKTNVPTFIEKARLIFGLIMMFAGLYFGLFSAGASEGLGLLSLMTSPFVMVSDK